MEMIIIAAILAWAAIKITRILTKTERKEISDEEHQKNLAIIKEQWNKHDKARTK